jgi:hypothetical protein
MIRRFELHLDGFPPLRFTSPEQRETHRWKVRLFAPLMLELQHPACSDFVAAVVISQCLAESKGFSISSSQLRSGFDAFEALTWCSS